MSWGKYHQIKVKGVDNNLYYAVFSPEAGTTSKLVLAICHWCKLPIPAVNVDDTVSREGIEYKAVMGDPKTFWHYLHPLFPDCFHAESNSPASPWFHDPRNYLAEDEPLFNLGEE